MAQKDDQAPATKKDFRELKQEMADMKKEIIHEFHFVAENLHRDFKDIFKDRLEQHEVRITRLEQHAGVAPV